MKETLSHVYKLELVLQNYKQTNRKLYEVCLGFVKKLRVKCSEIN